jgi:hypothetical protein
MTSLKMRVYVALAVLVCGSVTTVTADNYTCVSLAIPATNKIFGVNNGCTECTSDQPGGDGICQGSPNPGGWGTWCKLVPITRSIINRHKVGTPCYACVEDPAVNVTVMTTDTSLGGCQVSAETTGG